MIKSQETDYLTILQLYLLIMNCFYCFLISALICFQSLSQINKSNVEYVDPTIGGVGILLVPTRPLVHLPNSMVRVFPFKKDQLDDNIAYFPLTISSHRHTPLFSLLPISGPVDDSIWNKKSTYDGEKTHPYYYKTFLETSNAYLEFTPTSKSGLFKLSFKDAKTGLLRLKVINDGEIKQDGKNVIQGVEKFKGMHAYFYAEVNKEIKGTTYNSKEGKKQVLLDFGKQTGEILFKYGISFISMEQAKVNLQDEIQGWDFESVKNKALKVWDQKLSLVKVKGGTDAQKRVFYTALYRCYERMININEGGKYYSAYDHKVHSSEEPFYVDNWLWDTYIAMEPLMSILEPEMQNGKIKSYINMYEQSGWMPSFGILYGDFPVMTGNHAAAWFLDSWNKGIRDFNLDKAYEGVKKNSLKGTVLPYRNGPATSLDSFYNAKGYLPALKPEETEKYIDVHDFERRQSVSVTQEHSFDDWCIAEMANILGKREEDSLFRNRSLFYRNVFRKEKASVWPKDDAGNWVEPFDPKFSGGQGGRDYFTENNAYTYDWNVRHDLEGLFELMGGRGKAEVKLDRLFSEDLGRSKYKFWATFPDATGLVGQFSMGNEPSFHIPYLYNYLGSPWKTQKRIRMLLETWFTDNLFGIPGDEDGGGMSAFVVFSMMGFFPVTAGIPAYSIGSPVFDKVTIDFSNGKTFTVNAKNNSRDNKYIKKISLNGKPLTKTYFTHQDLLNGGNLEMEMQDFPNKEWGIKAEAFPPSAVEFRVSSWK